MMGGGESEASAARRRVTSRLGSDVRAGVRCGPRDSRSRLFGAVCSRPAVDDGGWRCYTKARRRRLAAILGGHRGDPSRAEPDLGPPLCTVLDCCD